MMSTITILSLALDLVLLLPSVLAQSACSFGPDGTTPTGSGICTCFESQNPEGWIVECSRNSLTEVPAGLPAETVFLSLNENSITTLTATSLQGLPSLKTLQIQNNGLRSDLIEDDAFANLQSLKSLDLSSNRISLSQAMIAHLLPLNNLQTLTLTNNNINTIDNSALQIFDRLDTLDLTSNVFVCDCELSWFRNWLLNTDHTGHQIMGATCSSPQQYQRELITAAGFCPPSLCYSCSGGSDVECNSQSNALQTCGSSQGACLNEIRVSNGAYTIQKNCKQLQACFNLVDQNARSCNEGTVNSVCRTCCLGDLCNGPASGVLDGYMLPGFPSEPNLVVQTTTELKTTMTEATTVSPTIESTNPPGTTLSRSTTSSSAPSTKQSSSITMNPSSSSFSTLSTTSAASTKSSSPFSPSGPPSTTQISSSPSETTSPTSSSGSPTQQPDNGSTGSPPFTTTLERHLTTESSTPQCPEETTSDEYGLITWVSTPGRETAEVNCPYGSSNNQEPATASRLCRIDRIDVTWDESDKSSCATSSQVLQRLSEVPITAENAQTVSKNLTTITTFPTELNETDVDLAVDVLEKLARSITEYKGTEVVENALDTINNLAGAEMQTLVAGQQDADVATRVLRLIDEFALNVDFEGERFDMVSERVNVVVIKISTEVVESLSFRSVIDDSGFITPQISFNSTTPPSPTEAQASLELPASLFETHRGEIDRVQFVLYKDTVFFEVITEAAQNSTTPTAPTTSTDNDIIERDALNSLVISASIGDLHIKGLRDPVKTSFIHQRPERAENPSCVFWDFNAAGGQGSWSTEGCIPSITSEGSTQCECDHLTNFALLMDIYGTTTTFNGDHMMALSIITFSGCILSIIGLIVTFFSYIMIRQLRSDRRTRVLLNLVVALTFMNILFLTDAVITEFGHPGIVACKLLGALLHYGLLTSVAWMALEAWHMYLALVKVFDSYTSHLMKKMCAVGWGLPAVIVGVVVGIDRDHYDYYNEFCWVEVGGIPFYAAFIAPALAVILFNFVIFALVTNQLCSLRRRSVTASSEQFDVSAQLRASLSITVLLGLTWGLGIFMIGEASLVFSYLFAIFNSFQGFSIFVFHCVLKEEVRLGWRKIFCPQCLTLEEISKSSTGQNFSSSNKQAQLQKRMTIEYQVESNGRGNHQSQAVAFHRNSHEVPRFNPFAENSEFYQDSSI